MGCCLFASLLAGAPRIAFLLWWVVDPARINAAFGTFIWPLLGVAVVPWTTLAYLAVFPGGVAGFDWVWMGLAVLADISTYGGGGVANRRRTTGASHPSTTNRVV